MLNSNMSGFNHSPWSEREIWLNLKANLYLKQKRPCPLKLVCMQLTSTPTSLNFEPILFDAIVSLPWTIVHSLKGKFGQIGS